MMTSNPTITQDSPEEQRQQGLSVGLAVEMFLRNCFSLLWEPVSVGADWQTGHSGRSCCSLEFEFCTVGGGEVRQGFCLGSVGRIPPSDLRAC